MFLCKGHLRGVEKMKKGIKISVRIFLYLVIPLFLSFIVIPNNEINLDLIEGNNQTYRKVSLNNLYNPDSWIDNINKLFGVPFDLNYYYFCFEDINTSSTNSKHIKLTYPRWDVFVEFNERKENLSLSAFSKNCTKDAFYFDDEVYFDSKLTYNISLSSGIYSPESTSIHPSNKVYALQHEKTLWIKRFIFIISVLSLIWLSTRIRSVIQKGWGEC